MTAKKDTTEDALPGAPEAPPKRDRKSETLHVAFLPADRIDGVEHDGFIDARIFGRKIEALEYAVSQEVRWDVVEVSKGDSLHAVIHSA